MLKTRTITKTEEYNSCDFCENPAQYHTCFICGKSMCEDHLKEFDVIEYDLEYVCPDCLKKEFTELAKLNKKYMKLCEVGKRVSSAIQEEVRRLKELD